MPTIPIIISWTGGSHSYIGGSANYQITSSATGSYKIKLGNGNDTINLVTGSSLITVGNGDDNITVTGGTNKIAAGNGTNVIVAGDGTNLISVGNGFDTITVGNGSNIISASGFAVIQAGNGTNTITDSCFHAPNGSLTATVSLTVGTGQNSIFLGTSIPYKTGDASQGSVTEAGALYNVTLGSHGGTINDTIRFANTNMSDAIAGIASNILNGAVTGDKILFSADSNSPIVIASQQSTGSFSSVAEAIQQVVNDAGYHGVAWVQYNGNTYIDEYSGASPGALPNGHTGVNTVIEIVGLHTFTSGANGSIILAS